ncbi:MAG TPA: hypothetical protein VM260_21060 [Pirellula sp.]|nr:hypothetical protein [Pirellula sp.]
MATLFLVGTTLMQFADVLKDPDLCVLLSDEGVLDLMELRQASQR